jgi:hypothetical protein
MHYDAENVRNIVDGIFVSYVNIFAEKIISIKA